MNITPLEEWASKREKMEQPQDRKKFLAIKKIVTLFKNQTSHSMTE